MEWLQIRNTIRTIIYTEKEDKFDLLDKFWK